MQKFSLSALVCEVLLKYQNLKWRLFCLQGDLYLCSTKQPVATRKPLDGGYQDLDYRYLYKIPWNQLVGANVSSHSASSANNKKGHHNLISNNNGKNAKPNG